MFENMTTTSPAAAQAAKNMVATPTVATAAMADGQTDAQGDAQLAEQRAIVDQIDLSLEANQRIEESIQAFDEPVLQVQINSSDVLHAIRPALDEGHSRMNREAFIVFAMMGIPPEKARLMANTMTGGSLEDMAVAGANGTGGAVSVRELAASLSGQSTRIEFGELSIVSQSIELDISTLETRFSDLAKTANISITEFRARIETLRVELSAVSQQDPLILDLDGNGIDITSLAGGNRFDIDGDGVLDQTAWIDGADALLALDRNGDGTINDGTELFGDQNGARDGFEELAKFDDNQDGTIDRKDRVFSSLVLLRADGSQGSLSDEGITSISVSMITPLDSRLIGGDLVARSQFERDDGTVGQVGEVLFDVKA